MTVSYGEVAAALGKSLLASRAVGLANGRNPISIIVPCHRVIGADGSLTGYGGGLTVRSGCCSTRGRRSGLAAGARRGAGSGGSGDALLGCLDSAWWPVAWLAGWPGWTGC